MNWMHERETNWNNWLGYQIMVVFWEKLYIYFQSLLQGSTRIILSSVGDGVWEFLLRFFSLKCKYPTGMRVAKFRVYYRHRLCWSLDLGYLPEVWIAVGRMCCARLKLCCGSHLNWWGALCVRVVMDGYPSWSSAAKQERLPFQKRACITAMSKRYHGQRYEL